jgi:hypothetical protein
MGAAVKPPGKTTLVRMQRTAMLEAERIEITQDYWVKDGRISEPEPHLVERRDDFAGMVRLIDAINSDQDLLERLKRRMAALAADECAGAAEDEDGAATAVRSPTDGPHHRRRARRHPRPQPDRGRRLGLHQAAPRRRQAGRPVPDLRRARELAALRGDRKGRELGLRGLS